MDPDFVPNYQLLEAFDDLYCEILTCAEDITPKVEVRVNEASVSNLESSSRMMPKLPKLSLPTFSGNILEWPIFYECFKSSIHTNSRLSNADKINYLIGQLSGKAKNVCTGLPPIGSNYQIIWDKVCERYQNPRILAGSYLQQILDFKPAQSGSVNNLDNILDRCDASYRALKELDIADLLDFTYAYLLWSKLDPDTRNLFENTRRNSSIFTYAEITAFIKQQIQIYNSTLGHGKSSSTYQNVKSKSHAFFGETNRKSNRCLICNSNQHTDIKTCTKFLDKSASDRFKIIKGKGMCINCFENHKVVQCKSPSVCNVCHYKHNSLLHFIKPVNNNSTSSVVSQGDSVTSPSSPGVVQSDTSAFCSTVDDSIIKCGSTVLLSTVIVHVYDHVGVRHRVRFLLDSGSQGNFLTEGCIKKLRLNISSSNMVVKGFGGDSQVLGASDLIIYSRLNSCVNYKVNVFVIEKITDRLPNVKILRESWEHFSYLPLANDQFCEPGPIEGILGAQMFATLLESRKIKSKINSLIALETKLGFVIMGCVPNLPVASTSVQSFHTQVKPPLEKLVRKFWELEDIPTQNFESPEDVECEKIFASTVMRENSGRYVVSLPFKHNANKLGESFSNALKRFKALENKFDKNPTLKQQYSAVIREHLEKGYISLVKNNPSIPHYFIPHHGVFKPDSVSTPLRCVFDASAKTTKQVSLNDLLYTGAKLQSDVVSLFLNFRLFSVAFTADIRQMYLRIGMHSDHRKFQLKLWRFSKTDEILVYSLDTVSFGVKSSPFLVLRTLKQLALDEADKYPFASSIVQRDFFMDDLVTSVNTVKEATELYSQLIELSGSAQFELTKWATNSQELFSFVPEKDRSPKIVSFDSDSLKILGMQWYPHSDVFTFSINAELRPCTKRNVLSTVARLFDPLGILAPVTLIKLLIKKLWILKLDWDEAPDREICLFWENFQTDLKCLELFKIPRHFGAIKDLPVELIGFCDACLESYGAMIYIRTVTPTNKILVNLVCAKTKVAPMRTESIPRLELCAAVLLARLFKFAMSSLEPRVQVRKLFAFFDSTVTLNWIGSPPYRWQTFVANRVSLIQSLVSNENWFHVEGVQNISDVLSRGLSPSQFMKMPNWVTGPEWLKLEPSSWPIRKISVNLDVMPEEKLTVMIATQRVVLTPPI
ncbi:uncharacterized protein LOC123302806 [Chrysoperla carnea]|uniref:uncharacterized protein LOC123302806 n=1 Tax=Chrysoperla carnea TaxID=189513 RepID=UPI001D05CCDE|nr:uncharacterized protein LOC123302806 [Chrysoperla carnea]